MAAPAHIARQNGKKGGRPKGSKGRPQISDFITKKEVAELIELAKTRAETSDRVLTFLLEQVLGKAVQPIGNEGGKPFLIASE